ncbi:ATP-binding cassette domain-containing protein [Catenulispora subtropica]|uniref:ABC transporter domain-containing protein n=1 Tax=Catenulispora subtropica TaxID=450798 RepID=A0ABN2QVV7_9ACTN
MVTLAGVGKQYGRGRPVLADVDMTVRAGDVVSVVGGNGSGKSTLLRILAGITLPTTGTLTDVPYSVGYVPERFSANTRMAAHSYLCHMGRIRGLPTRRASERADELLERLKLEPGPEFSIRDLSKGNAQKVAVAQSLMTRPDLLILDEPWSGLDTSAHGTLSALITETAAAGAAVVFTDHRESVARMEVFQRYEIEGGRVRKSLRRRQGHR